MTRFRTSYGTLTEKYYKVEFVEDDGDPYKRFFCMVNDHFQKERPMPLTFGEFAAITFRALQGSLRMKKRELTKKELETGR